MFDGLFNRFLILKKKGPENNSNVVRAKGKLAEQLIFFRVRRISSPLVLSPSPSFPLPQGEGGEPKRAWRALLNSGGVGDKTI
jgi:hypothetical protein